MRVPRLHVITDDARLAAPAFVDDARRVLQAGGPDVALHLRGRDTTAARLHALALALLPAASAAGAALLINDRVDVALAAAADGAHLREDSLDVAHARSILGDGRLIGVSRHAGWAGPARDAAADFVMLGSIYPTGSHPGNAPAGLAALRPGTLQPGAPGDGPQARGTALPPLIAIGGVTPARVGEVLGAGAYGVAALSGIWDAGAAAAVVEYLVELDRHAGARKSGTGRQADG